MFAFPANHQNGTANAAFSARTFASDSETVINLADTVFTVSVFVMLILALIRILGLIHLAALLPVSLIIVLALVCRRKNKTGI